MAWLIFQKLNTGESVGNLTRFRAYQFFRFCRRSAGGRAYESLDNALERLRSTAIRYDMPTGDGGRVLGFHSWLKTGRMVAHVSRTGRLGRVEVEIDDWVWGQIVRDRTMRSLNPRYFEIGSGIGRRIYEIAHKHCGTQPDWGIDLDLLAAKVGYQQDDLTGLKNFKRFLLDLVEANDLPDYEVYMASSGDGKRLMVSTAEARKMRGIKRLKLLVLRREDPEGQ